MIIAGAGGHANEIADLLENDKENILFFEDARFPNVTLNGFTVTHSEEQVADHFKKDNRFILGVGNSNTRHMLSEKLSDLGGRLTSVVSRSAIISKNEVSLGAGLNIMNFVLISNNVMVGEGTLINARVNLHHNVNIGKYCEISPAAVLLGNVSIGDFTQVGSGAIILPGIQIGNNCIIGAGAVITKNVTDNATMIGIPGRKLKD